MAKITASTQALLFRDYHSDPTTVSDLFMTMFKKGHQFEVFAEVAFGISENRNGRFDSAQGAFCKASIELQQSLRDQVWRGLNPNATSLMAKIDGLLQSNFDAARADPNYKGSLTSPALQPTNRRICPEL